jgi:homoserine dehydrogenase
MKLCIIGFGAVGLGVSRVIAMKKEMLMEKYGLDVSVVAVTDRSGAAINQDGLDIGLLIDTKEKTGKISEYPEYGISNVKSVQVLEEVDYDCLIEVTPTNIDDGEPAKTHMLKAMKMVKML